MTASHAFNCNLLHYKKAKGIILMICIEEFARTNLYIYIYMPEKIKKESLQINLWQFKQRTYTILVVQQVRNVVTIYKDRLKLFHFPR